MAIKLADTSRNARLTALYTDVGAAGAVLKLRDGTPPATAGAADVGNVIASINLPNPWLGTPASGAVALAGVWTTTASLAGTVTHFRIYAGGTTCKIQGTAATSGADMTVDNATVTLGQTINVTVFGLTDANG